MVNGNVSIQFGVTLNIRPGTIIKFNNLAWFKVIGTLRARGSADNPITFTSNEADSNNRLQGGDWEHIIFDDPSSGAEYDGSGFFVGGSIIEYAVIEYAVDAIIARTTPLISDNIIRNNSGTGITAVGDIRITNNTIVDNARGGLSIGVGNATIRGNTITGNVATLGGALYLECQCTVRNNIITGNLATSTHGGGGISSRGGLSMYLNDIYDNRSGPGEGIVNDFTNRLPVGSPDVNIDDNWWGTTTPASIEGAIWHFVDDSGLGVVEYSPPLGAPVFPKRFLDAGRLALFRHV